MGWRYVGGMSRKLRLLCEDLMESARFDIMLGCPKKDRIARCHRSGQELPDDCLPGRAIMALEPDKRALLAKLTADQMPVMRFGSPLRASGRV